jgi:hypothetical protein
MTSADLIEWLKTGATVVGAGAIVLAYVRQKNSSVEPPRCVADGIWTA